MITGLLTSLDYTTIYQKSCTIVHKISYISNYSEISKSLRI